MTESKLKVRSMFGRQLSNPGTSRLEAWPRQRPAVLRVGGKKIRVSWQRRAVDLGLRTSQRLLVETAQPGCQVCDGADGGECESE